MNSILITVDARLAKKYRSRYERAFPSDSSVPITLEEFIRTFLEDRLREELCFVENEKKPR